ncbi:unnamed protein product [Moneuplotes crassus]|uniref:Uncharacterized protein n=1 Tax=Euplotes crassus TaxID=5936 RepID=A0AAD1XJF0_EUPCR|nr:unnamed protein product [Moneuplotes crassus]
MSLHLFYRMCKRGTVIKKNKARRGGAPNQDNSYFTLLSTKDSIT